MKNKSKEELIVEFFDKERRPLTNKEIEKELSLKSASNYTKELVYFGYLTRNNINRTYCRTSKPYVTEKRKEEKADDGKKDYEIALNKVFVGSFLYQNLGHEIINFMKDDNGDRYIYLNPWGNRGTDAEEETNYVFHIIESSIKDEKGMFEVIAVSKVDRSQDDYYARNDSDRKTEKEHAPTFDGYSFYDIFFCGPKSDKAHVYTYRAEKVFFPNNNKRIVVKIKSDEAMIDSSDERTIKIDLVCNPQHDIAYADKKGIKVYGSEPNSKNDVMVLKELLDLNKGYMREATDEDDINLTELDDEQCFAVISDRTNLEDSTSNQIAYFFSRDRGLLNSFISEFLGIEIKERELFEVFREKDKIDLLLLSDEHAIVIENKIDSSINGKEENPGTDGKYGSQLSDYYSLLCDKKDERFNNILETNKRFFVLAPEYNPITQSELNDVFRNGNKYTLLTYNKLFDFINMKNYRPLGGEPSELGMFLFKEFKKTIEYISWSKAKQRERTAYIRLKQRMAELRRNQKSQNK